MATNDVLLGVGAVLFLMGVVPPMMFALGWSVACMVEHVGWKAASAVTVSFACLLSGTAILFYLGFQQLATEAPQQDHMIEQPGQEG